MTRRCLSSRTRWRANDSRGQSGLRSRADGHDHTPIRRSQCSGVPARRPASRTAVQRVPPPRAAGTPPSTQTRFGFGGGWCMRIGRFARSAARTSASVIFKSNHSGSKWPTGPGLHLHMLRMAGVHHDLQERLVAVDPADILGCRARAPSTHRATRGAGSSVSHRSISTRCSQPSPKSYS